MLQTIINVLLIVWLFFITIFLLYERQKNKAIKIIKNKKDIKAKRYIIFYLVFDERDAKAINVSEIENAIRNSVKELMGRIWLEIANPRIILYLDDKKQGIISTNRAGYKAVLASLPLVKNIGSTEVLVVPKRTTGSLKKARKILGIR